MSPEAYSTDEFLRFFQISSDSEDFISWVGDVANLEDTGSAPYARAHQAIDVLGRHLKPVAWAKDDRRAHNADRHTFSILGRRLFSG